MLYLHLTLPTPPTPPHYRPHPPPPACPILIFTPDVYLNASFQFQQGHTATAVLREPTLETLGLLLGPSDRPVPNCTGEG